MARWGAGDGGHRAVYLEGFRFEPDSGRLSAAGADVALRSKAAAVLAVLVERAGEVVSRRDLLAAVWPEGFVGDAALSGCVNELRRAFGDDPARPRFVATAHRRGYRLVAQVRLAPPQATPARLFVGRDPTLATLSDWWADAGAGRRQAGFLAGPAGVGKSAVIDRFVSGLAGPALVGWGQCVQQFGAGEAYLPVLHALGGLARGPAGGAVREVLRGCAPGWLAELPGLDGGAPGPSAGASTARMLREFAVAVETLSAQRPLLLVLEDLHDADRPTAELIGYLARRREPARVLLLGSYRSEQMIARDHPLRRVVQDLRSARLCRQVLLEFLSAAEVGAYLAARLAPRRPAPQLVEDMYERTEGNALFVVAVTDFLLSQGLLTEQDGTVRARDRLAGLGVPDEVRDMLERQVDSLDDTDRRLLAVAAADGTEFTVATVHAGLAGGPAATQMQIEDRCERLAQGGALLLRAGAAQWPDGTLSGRYRFVHEMYREVLYERLAPARRAEVHRGIGARLAAGYAANPGEVAAESGMHFEHGRDYPAAAGQFNVAAARALSRSAYPEAVAHARRVLALLDRVPDHTQRSRLALAAYRTEAVATAATWGWRDPRARQDCLRLRELAVEFGDTAALLAALVGLHNTAMTDADTAGMRAGVEQVDALLDTAPEPAVRLVDDLLHLRADNRAARHELAWQRAERMLATYRPDEHRQLALLVGEQFDVAAHLYGALALWHLGYPDRARQHARHALDSAREQEIPAGLARALWFTAVVHLLCGDADRVRRLAAELDAICLPRELPLWQAGGQILAGWATARLGDVAAGLAQARRGVQSWDELAGIGDSFHQCLIGELCLAGGDATGGLDALRRAREAIDRTGYLQGEPELLRLEGELVSLLGAGRATDAERLLRSAYDLAAARGERALELRAASSLARLWAARDRPGPARDLLAGVYGRFPEGRDTHDLNTARELLERLRP